MAETLSIHQHIPKTLFPTILNKKNFVMRFERFINYPLQTFFIDHGIHHNLHAFSLLIFIFILCTHRSNIESMYKGTEAKF